MTQAPASVPQTPEPQSNIIMFPGVTKLPEGAPRPNNEVPGQNISISYPMDPESPNVPETFTVDPAPPPDFGLDQTPAPPDEELTPIGSTTLDVPVRRVLNAIPEDLTQVLVIGILPDGDVYSAASTASAPLLNLMLDRIKFRILGLL